MLYISDIHCAYYRKKLLAKYHQDKWMRTDKENMPMFYIYILLSPHYKSTKKSVWKMKAHGLIYSVLLFLQFAHNYR